MRSVFFFPGLVFLFNVWAVSAWTQSPPAAHDRVSIDTLIQLLKDKDADVRAGAADSLSELWRTAAPAAQALVDALDDRDENVRVHVRDALMAIGPPALPALTDAVKKGPIRKRLLALEAVRGIGFGPPRQDDVFKDIIPVLIECLKDKNPRIRAATVRCLMAIGDISCIPCLIKVLEKDKDVEVRYEVIQAFIAFEEKAVAAMPLLARIAVRDYDKQYEGATTLGHEAAAALSSIGDPAVPVLASIVADAKVKSVVRRTALSALRRMNGQPKFASIAPVLCQALTDRDEHVRLEAAATLGRLESADEHVRSALVTATTDKSPSVRMEAAVTIYRFDPKNPCVLATLMPALDDKNAKIRGSACFRLGEIGAPSAAPAIPKLIELVSDKDSGVRLSAINALSIMAGQKANISAAIPALTTAIRDPNPVLRKAAQDCLKKTRR